MRKFFRKFLTTMISLAFITACYPTEGEDSNLGPTPHRDPQAPGAEGTIMLGSEINPDDFLSLHIRAFPNTASKFDINTPYPDPIEPMEEAAYSISNVSFPHSYQVGGRGVRVSDFEEWRVFAWLSRTDQSDSESFPDSGDIFGNVVFKLSDCSWACTQKCYCGVTRDVDVVLDTVVP